MHIGTNKHSNMLIINNEVGRMWKEAVAVYFNVYRTRIEDLNLHSTLTV